MTTCDNFINNKFVAPLGGNYMDVTSPAANDVIGKVAVSETGDVALAIEAANAAFDGWSSLTMKARATIMLKFHALVREHTNQLADIIVLENGKNFNEAGEWFF
jgi:malonate-semialdehyde dehydrogenase (acetylating)/methylmalonate-semialdehyde dehydrogenase